MSATSHMIVNNRTDHAISIYSHDGDCVSIQPKSGRQKVQAKFAWQVPKNIMVLERVGPAFDEAGNLINPDGSAPSNPV